MGEKGLQVSAQRLENLIQDIRGQKVILDSDLARIYGVSAKRLNEQVKRNSRRFPSDFMFRLTSGEWSALRSQNATLKIGQGRHRKYLPSALPEPKRRKIGFIAQ